MSTSLFERSIPNEPQPSAPVVEDTAALEEPEVITRRGNGHRGKDRTLYSIDREAEVALLGALLNGANPTLVDPAAWTLQGAQAVHAAITHLYDGKPLDGRLVARAIGNELDRLQVDTGTGVVTGEHALVMLELKAPATSAAPRFAAIVADHHRRRLLAADITNATEALHQGDTNRVLEHLEHGLSTASTTATTSSSWKPVDLAGILAGDSPKQPPTMLHRTDGQALLYPGKVNAFNAESETAKTWLALWAAAEEIDNGNHVVFIDFEDRPETAVERLLLFTLEPHQIASHFHYVRPDDPLDIAAHLALDELLADTRASLAIIDGITEAMSMNGLSLLDNEDIARFYALLPRRIAATGAGVINIDHLPKDTSNRKGGIGGQHKRAGVDGVILKLEPVKPFGRGLHGVARLVVDKDRPGHVRSASVGGSFAGELHLDSTGGWAVLTVEAPSTPSEHGRKWDGPTECMATLTAFFDDHPREEFAKTSIPAKIRAISPTGYRDQTIYDSLERLVADRVLQARQGRSNSTLYAKFDDGLLDGVA